MRPLMAGDAIFGIKWRGFLDATFNSLAPEPLLKISFPTTINMMLHTNVNRVGIYRVDMRTY